MKNRTLSSRKQKIIACKKYHNHFFSALHSAIRRKPGGFEALSHNTGVEASTLRNQLNPDREQDAPTADTLLRVIEHLQDADFAQWFNSYYFGKESHEDDSELDLLAVLHLINRSSCFISTATSTIEDSVITSEEMRDILSALNKNIAEKQAVADMISRHLMGELS